MAIATGPRTKNSLHLRSKQGIKELGKDLFSELKHDKVTSQAAVVAYNTVFALPAVVILLVMVAAVVNRTTDVTVIDNLRGLIHDHAPASTRQLLNDQVDAAIANVGGGGLSIGIFLTAGLALWSGSSAVGALMESFNLAYGVEEKRTFVRKKLMTVGLTLLLAVSVNLAFALLVFGRRIGAWLADRISAGTVFDFFWNLGRWPAAVVAIGAFLALLYYFGPDVEQRFRWVTPGVLMATLLWLMATAGFGLYLRLADPGSAYGLVGSVLVLLFFLHVTAIIFITGAELNAILENRADDRPNRNPPG